MSSRPARRNTAAPTMVTASASFHHFMRIPLSPPSARAVCFPRPGLSYPGRGTLVAGKGKPSPRGAVAGGLACRARRDHDGGMGIEPDAVASYVDRAVEAMAGIVGDLGDDLANTRPGLPGANSPYAILRHCLGVMEFWGGHVVAGRTVDRDRAAEFRASGPAAGLIAGAQEAQRRFRADIVTADPAARPRGGGHDVGTRSEEHTSELQSRV